MIIIMKNSATTQQIAQVVARVERDGFTAHLSQGEERTIIGVIGDDRPIDRSIYELYEGVEKTVPILKKFKLASRDFQPEVSQFRVGGVKIGGKELVIMAGPCAVEGRTKLLEIAHAVKEAGANCLRGGAFKPRTSPYAFQGMGEEGLEILAEAREQTGLPIVTEVMSTEQVPLVAKYADILQIGARNCQNYALLTAVGKSGHPALLKRGMATTIEEWLMSAEYMLAQGNRRVMMCERGIRTFETATRNTADINALAVLKHLTHLPIAFDPSHATGKWEYVLPVARAGVAAGADCLLVEVHQHPAEAWSDGAQSLTPERFHTLVTQTHAVAAAIGRA
ncbi:MAG TPA: 3-deoxy-7-phosphoheptulonate synthase [Anaerolineales bacterium]|nr:3-deoxy-7-phosphoheptulonate synthase [Anaerolineales bacterium]